MTAPGTAATDFHGTIAAMFQGKGGEFAYINRCRSSGKAVLTVSIHKSDSWDLRV